MKTRSIIFYLLILALVFFSLFMYSSLNSIRQNYRHDLKNEYPENIYSMYWNFFKDRNNVEGVDTTVLLSRDVAYRIYKDKTRSFLLRFFYEWFIQISLNKKEKINIMLSTDIYKGGVKGIENASIKYFGKNVTLLSDHELYELFTHIY